jgi:hypothetical protein
MTVIGGEIVYLHVAFVMSTESLALSEVEWVETSLIIFEQ